MRTKVGSNCTFRHIRLFNCQKVLYDSNKTKRMEHRRVNFEKKPLKSSRDETQSATGFSKVKNPICRTRPHQILPLNFDCEVASAFVAFVLNRHPIVPLIVADLGELAPTRSYDATFEIEAISPLLGVMIILIVHADGSLFVDWE